MINDEIENKIQLETINVSKTIAKREDELNQKKK